MAHSSLGGPVGSIPVHDNTSECDSVNAGGDGSNMHGMGRDGRRNGNGGSHSSDDRAHHASDVERGARDQGMRRTGGRRRSTMEYDSTRRDRRRRSDIRIASRGNADRMNDRGGARGANARCGGARGGGVRGGDGNDSGSCEGNSDDRESENECDGGGRRRRYTSSDVSSWSSDEGRRRRRDGRRNGHRRRNGRNDGRRRHDRRHRDGGRYCRSDDSYDDESDDTDCRRDDGRGRRRDGEGRDRHRRRHNNDGYERDDSEDCSDTDESDDDRYQRDDGRRRRRADRYDYDDNRRRDGGRRNRRDDRRRNDDRGDRARRPRGGQRMRVKEYNGRDSWQSYHMQFEKVMEENGVVSRDGKLSQLVGALEGRAREYFTTLSRDTRESYRRVCEQMEFRFGKSEDPAAARASLSSIKQRYDETLADFAERVRHAVQEGYGRYGRRTRALMESETFLKGVSWRAPVYSVLDKEPPNLREAMRLYRRSRSLMMSVAPGNPQRRENISEGEENDRQIRSVQYEADSRGSDGYNEWVDDAKEYDVSRVGGGKKYTRKEAETMLKSLNDMVLSGGVAEAEPKCYGCGESGHMAKDCPKGKGKHCFVCGDTEHVAKNCPKAQCFKCHEHGHFARDCVNKVAEREALN